MPVYNLGCDLSLSPSHFLSVVAHDLSRRRLSTRPTPHQFHWEDRDQNHRRRRVHIYTNLFKVFPNFCPVEFTLRGYKNVGKEANTGNLLL